MNSLIGERRTYSNIADTHEHHFAQLILPLQGQLRIETSLHQCLLNEYLFFLPPQCQHTFSAQSNNEFLVLDIPDYLFSQAELQQMQGGVYTRLDERWQAIRFLLLEEIKHRPTEQDLTSLFHYAHHLLSQKQTPPSIRYIHANYHTSMKLTKLANLEGYSLTYYCEWFKKLTGTTPNAYVQTIRLQKAKALLEHTNFTILEIAQQVGYVHHASLTRLFKQLEQMTPLGYRRQCRSLVKKCQKFS